MLEIHSMEERQMSRTAPIYLREFRLPHRPGPLNFVSPREYIVSHSVSDF